MPTVSLPRVPAPPHNPSLQELQAYVSQLADIMARFFKETEWLQTGNMDSQNFREITASKISAGTIDTGEITIGADESGKYYRIDGDGIVAYNGTDNTLEFDLNTGLLTLLSVLIKSKGGGYPLVIMDPSSDLFGAYGSATSSIVIKAFGNTGVPYQEFKDGASIANIDISGGALSITSNTSIEINGIDLELRPTDLYLYANNQSHLPYWGALYSDGQSESLQDALDEKVDQSTANASYAVNMAFDPGTRNLKLFNANGSTIATVNIP